MASPDKVVQEKTARSEGLLLSALDEIEQGILIYDDSLKVIAFNKRALEILNLPVEEFKPGSSYEDWIRYIAAREGNIELDQSEDKMAERLENRLEVIRSLAPYRTRETKLNRKILEISGKPLSDGIFVTTYTEVTERIESERALRESEKRLLEILGESPIGVNILGLDGAGLFSNTAFCDMTGWSRYEVGFSQIRDSFVDPDIRKVLFKETQAEGHINDRQLEFTRKDGSRYWAILSMRMIEFEGQESVLAWIYEITERIEMEEKLRRNQEFLQMQIVEQRDREERLEAQAVELVSVADELAVAEEKMKFLANHDALTGLPGLRLCRERIEMAMTAASLENKLCALMFVDLDGFKVVNDTHGHEAGDNVLCAVADRIRDLTTEVDTVSRIGGDEFIVILCNITGPDDAALKARQMIDSLATEFPLDTAAASIGASIGIALYPGDGETSEDLLRNADNKMYDIKQSGKNNFGFVSPIESD